MVTTSFAIGVKSVILIPECGIYLLIIGGMNRAQGLLSLLSQCTYSIYKGNSRKTPVVFKALAHPNKVDFDSSYNLSAKLIFCCISLVSFMSITPVVVFTQPI